jgi:hypothetical protein
MMDKELVDKVLKQYINYCDYITIYEKFDDIFKDKEVNLQQKKNFVDTVDKMLITLNDDELFIITQLYNLELEPYLRKWTPGSVPDNEIILMDGWDKKEASFYRSKASAFDKLNVLFDMIDA